MLEQLKNLQEELGERRFSEIFFYGQTELSKLIGVEVEKVERCRDEGGGDYDGYHCVNKIGDKYYRINACYTSEEGVMFGYGDDKLYEVKPVEKTIIEWESV